MNDWDFTIARAAALHDLEQFVAPNQYEGRKSEMEIGHADYQVGMMFLSTNPKMSARQYAACRVLLCAGPYRTARDAKRGLEKRIKEFPALNDHPKTKGVYSQLIDNESGLKSLLLDILRCYVLHLPDNEAKPLLSFIEENGDQQAAPVELSSVQEWGDPLKKAVAEDQQDIDDLFDPLPREGIITLFEKISEMEWNRYFDRASRNELSATRSSVRSKLYSPAKVAEWLVKKGVYSREHADRRLANNLPPRSKHLKYLVTGTLE
jgi:hypothetical protein